MLKSALLCALLVPGGLGFECLDSRGKSVDWWFGYKFPGSLAAAWHGPSSGLAPGYLADSGLGLQDDKAPLTRTLAQLESRLVSPLDDDSAARLLNSSRTGGFLMYSDQPDGDRPSAVYGHAKGVLAVSKGGAGFWLVHSTPHFPGRRSVKFPDTEMKYGQTFLCVKMSAKQVDTAAKQLLHSRPFVYRSTFDRSALGLPNLAKLLAGEWEREDQLFRVQLGEFTSFAKNAAWGDDLYAAIANEYRVDMYVESWLRGSKVGSYCRPKHAHEVLDVKTMVALGQDGKNITWSEGADHAKWAVMLGRSSGVCVGDINRMTTQRSRGGGAVCFHNAHLNQKLYNSIADGYMCKHDSSP